MENKLSKSQSKQNALITMIGVIMAVVFIYFVLGGDTWKPMTWAIFTVMAVWIVVMNTYRDAGLLKESSYWKWQNRVELLIILALLFSYLWNGSLEVLICGIILGIFWLQSERRNRETKFKLKSNSSSEK
jgi:hypothetical protein